MKKINFYIQYVKKIFVYEIKGILWEDKKFNDVIEILEKINFFTFVVQVFFCFQEA